MKKQSKKTEKGKQNNLEFAVVTYFFLAIFLCMMGYFVYFQVAKSEEFINNPYNSRQELFGRKVSRGEIYSADGKILAETITDRQGNEERLYPYGRLFAHVVGYSTNGRYGIEAQENFSLLRSNTFFLEKAVNELQNEKNPGDDVVTTLNYNLQVTAYDAMGDFDGAVLVMEPSTGKILAMISKPDFDPNQIEEDWEELISEENQNSELLNRATQGLYPPGSVFKIFTTLEYIHENPDYGNYSYDCTGSFSREGQTIHCYRGKSHGEQSLAEAFANSCNSAYASLSTELDLERFASLCSGLLFDTTLPGGLGASKSSFVLEPGDSLADVTETAIGQGKTLVTPLHMALVTCAIANDGVLMNPYLVDDTVNADGDVIKSNEPTAYGTLLSERDAALMQEYMRDVVEDGTAEALSGQSYAAAGKTGSAEFSSASDASHSWFVGYAHREDKEDIAVAIIVEDSGTGSEYAVPIAKKIFDAYYNE